MFSNVNKYNQVNDVIDTTLKFDSKPSLGDIPVKDPQQLVTIRLRGGKRSINTLGSDMTCLLDSIASSSMLKRKHIK